MIYKLQNAGTTIPNPQEIILNTWEKQKKVEEAQNKAKEQVALEKPKYVFVNPYDYTRGWRETTEDAAKQDKYTIQNLGGTQEEAQKAYNDTGKNSRKQLAATTTQGLLMAPMLGEFGTYGLLGGAIRLGAGYGSSKLGEGTLGSAGDGADKQLNTKFLGTTGRIVGGLGGGGGGSSATTPLFRNLAGKGITLHIPQETFMNLRGQYFNNQSNIRAKSFLEMAKDRNAAMDFKFGEADKITDYPEGYQFHMKSSQLDTRKVAYPEGVGEDGTYRPFKGLSGQDNPEEVLGIADKKPAFGAIGNDFFVGPKGSFNTYVPEHGLPTNELGSNGFNALNDNVEFYKYLPVHRGIGTGARVKYYIPKQNSTKILEPILQEKLTSNISDRSKVFAERYGINPLKGNNIDEDILIGKTDAIDYLNSTRKAITDQHNIDLSKKVFGMPIFPQSSPGLRASTDMRFISTPTEGILHPRFGIRLTHNPNNSTKGTLLFNRFEPSKDQMSLDLSSDLKDSAFHEYLHRGNVGGGSTLITPAFYRGKVKKLLKPEFGMNSYLGTPKENAAKLLEIGRRTNIMFEEYPGFNKAIKRLSEIVDTDIDGNMLNKTRGETKPKRVGDALQGKYIGLIPIGLGATTLIDRE